MIIGLLTCIMSITKNNTYCNNCCKNCTKKKALIKNDENNKTEKDEKEIENKKKDEDENLKLKYIEFDEKIENLIKYDNDTFKIKENFHFITKKEFNEKNIDAKNKELENIKANFCILLDNIIDSLREKYNSLVEENKKQNENDQINIYIKDSDFNKAKTNINKIIEIDKKLKDIEFSFKTNIENLRGLVSKNFENINSNIDFINILKVDGFDFDNIQQEIEKSNNKNELVIINNKIIEFEKKFKDKINETLNGFKTELTNYKNNIKDLSSSLDLKINLKIKKEINNYEIDKLDNLDHYKNITNKLKEFNKYINDYIIEIVGIYNNKIEKLNIKNDNLNKLIDELKKTDTSKISEIGNIIKNVIIEKYKNITLSEIIQNEKIKKDLEEIKKFKRNKDVIITDYWISDNEYIEGPFLPKKYLELLPKIIKKINEKIDDETYIDILTAKLNDIEIDLSKYDKTLEYDESAECEKNKNINVKHKKYIDQIVSDVNRLGSLYEKLKITTCENKDELKNLFYRIYLNYVNNNTNCNYCQEMNGLFYNSLFMFINKDNNNNLYYNELLLYKIFFQILKKEINIDKNKYFLKLDKDAENTFLSYSKGNIIYWVYFFNVYFNYNNKPILDYLNFYYKNLPQSIEDIISDLSLRFFYVFFKESFLKEIIILLLIDGNFLFDLYINYIIYCLKKAKNSNFNQEILYNVNDLFKKD